MKQAALGIALGVIALLGTFKEACADWQYTRWGMTEAQVISASGGRAVPVMPQDAKGGSANTVNKLWAPYSSGQYQFRAIFGFDSAGRLGSVFLVVVDKANGPAIKNDLLGKYGTPFQTSPSMLTWYAGGDEVMFRDTLGQLFSILYRPRTSAGASGL